jgi:hypothetical protein
VNQLWKLFLGMKNQVGKLTGKPRLAGSGSAVNQDDGRVFCLDKNLKLGMNGNQSIFVAEQISRHIPSLG